MANEGGTWIMYGLQWDDPGCIHTAEETIEYINEIGFLPLFKNEVPGFSLEEHTVPELWWSESPEKDPWEWRAIIARSGNVAYGKFFDNKAGFISKEWLPYFANYRRDGYDFDALWDDEKASRRQKKIMDLFAEEKSEAEYFSADLKQLAGFGKEGEKGFDGTVTNLQMMTYLCTRDFKQRKNKKGQSYGWSVAIYSTPEHIFGYESVTSAYGEDPIESGKRIAMRIMERFPDADANSIKKILGFKVGEAPERKKANKKVQYPSNLLKAIDLNIDTLSDDQMLGLEFLLGQLKEAHQEVIQLRFEQGLTFKEIGERTGKSSGRCGQLCKMAIARLKRIDQMDWVIKGYKCKFDEINLIVEEERKKFIRDGKIEQAGLMLQSPDVLDGITSNMAKKLFKAGIINIGILRERLKEEFWSRPILGIADDSAKKIIIAMYRAGLIDENFKVYKELSMSIIREGK